VEQQRLAEPDAQALARASGRAKKMVARVSRRKKTIFVAVFDKNNYQ
jgi:hypothetical protein